MKCSKQLGLILLFAFLLLSIRVNAQKKVSELTIVYDYTISSDNSSRNDIKPEKATNTIYIKGNLVRSETSNSLFSSSLIYDSNTGLGTILKEVSGQRLLIHLTHNDWKEMNKVDDGIVFSNTSEIKTIAGYKCSQAVGKTSKGWEVVVYYTTDIVPDNKDYNVKFRNLDGLPLEYELKNGNFKIRYVVSKINLNPIPASKFDLPKSGYREMTYEESKKLKSGN